MLWTRHSGRQRPGTIRGPELVLKGMFGFAAAFDTVVLTHHVNWASMTWNSLASDASVQCMCQRSSIYEDLTHTAIMPPVPASTYAGGWRTRLRPCDCVDNMPPDIDTGTDRDPRIVPMGRCRQNNLTRLG